MAKSVVLIVILYIPEATVVLSKVMFQYPWSGFPVLLVAYIHAVEKLGFISLNETLNTFVSVSLTDALIMNSWFVYIVPLLGFTIVAFGGVLSIVMVTFLEIFELPERSVAFTLKL